MIISHQHRFIFVKGIKVAGTSFEAAMHEFCGPDDVVTSISTSRTTDTDMVEPLIQNSKGFTNHMRPERIRKRIGPIWDEYLKLTIIRNPWDMMVSRHFWKRPRHEALERVLYDPMDHAEGLDLYLRFETLQADFDAFLERLGLPPKKLPRLKDKCRPRSRTSYREFFKNRPREREAVTRIAKRYCEQFGYSY